MPNHRIRFLLISLALLAKPGFAQDEPIALRLTSQSPLHTLSAVPVSPFASLETQRLLQYLNSIYGSHILAGQQTGQMLELEYLHTFTGRLPAICGFDFLMEGETARALEWASYGGLVTFSWHWRAPKGGSDFYAWGTTFDVSRAVVPGTEEHDLILRDIDLIAAQLMLLSEARVPVLWRPLHEAEGGWFWWGAKGSEPCKQLYRILFDRLTRFHGLDNLIWVWTSDVRSTSSLWYPGSDVVDLLGMDNYPPPGNFDPFANLFLGLTAIGSGDKMVALTETGSIPSPDLLVDQRAGWLYFNTWSGRFVLEEENNPVAHLLNVYTHDHVVTLDELPSEVLYGRAPVAPPAPKSVEFWHPAPVPLGFVAYEAEAGAMVGTELGSAVKGYLGDGYVTGFDQEGDRVSVRVNARRAGGHWLRIRYASVFGPKRNRVYVNGGLIGELEFPQTNRFADAVVGIVSLQTGENTITVEKSWGYFEVDAILTARVPDRSRWRGTRAGRD